MTYIVLTLYTLLLITLFFYSLHSYLLVFYYQKFRNKGITLFQYWQHMHDAVPWDKFPKAVFLKKHVLGLPVHQDINFIHLDRILEVLKASSELYSE